MISATRNQPELLLCFSSCSCTVTFIKRQGTKKDALHESQLTVSDHGLLNSLCGISNPANCPSTWYNQPFVGRYKSHCFYEPTGVECENIYNTFKHIRRRPNPVSVLYVLSANLCITVWSNTLQVWGSSSFGSCMPMPVPTGQSVLYWPANTTHCTSPRHWANYWVDGAGRIGVFWTFTRIRWCPKVDPSVGVKSDFGILISYRIPEECFEEWKRVSKGRPADMSGITYEKFLIRSEDLLRLHSTVRPFPWYALDQKGKIDGSPTEAPTVYWLRWCIKDMNIGIISVTYSENGEWKGENMEKRT